MTDILVIGGGMAGLSTAARLSTEAQVTVLEAENALGYHASGRSAAVFEKNYGTPSVQALTHASEDYMTGHDGGYLSPRGLLIIAQENEEEAFRSDIIAMGLDEITPQEALGIVPVLDPAKLAFAGYQTGAQDINTDRLLQGFTRELRQNDGVVKTGHRVEKIEFSHGQWHVSAGDSTFTAPLLLNAAGAWADQIAILAGVSPLGIIPHRRSMARIPAPGSHDVSAWPVFFGTAESWYAKPDAGALIVSPADEDPVEPHDAWAEDMTLAQGLARYENMVTTPVTRLLSSWAGLRSFAPDRTLVLGPDPGHPGFIWCAGQGGYGIQTSPAASQLVADRVMGRPSALAPSIVAQLSPERF